MFGNERYPSDHYLARQARFGLPDAATVAVIAAAGFGIGTAAGALLEEEMGPYGVTDYTLQREEVRDTDWIEDALVRYEALAESPNTHEELVGALGEACVASVEIYGDDGVLSSVKTDLALEDVLSDPEQPCGDSMTDVRVAFELVEQQAEDEEFLAESDYTELTKQLQETEADNERIRRELEADQNHNGWLVGGIIGLPIGLVAGVVTNIIYLRAKRREYEAQIGDLYR